MKKSFIPFALATLLLAGGLASCLKDKGYDNNEYGLNVGGTKAVSIPQATLSPVNISVNSQTTSQTIDAPPVSLEAPTASNSDVHVKLQLNQSLLPAGVTPLPPALYNIASLDLTIPAGSMQKSLQITLPNTSSLDPTQTYGLGLQIASVDNGYAIASNMKSVVITISVKNKYDGHYRLRGFHNRSSPDYTAPYDEEVDMVTSGPNSVYMVWDPAGGPAHPIAGGTGAYGSFTTNFIFDPATNLMTAWDLTPYPTTVTPSVMTNGQVPGAGISRYDPATKTIYAYFYYNANPTGRGFLDTLTYLGPRQ